MFSAARAAPLTRSGPRPLPIAVSVLVHAVILSSIQFAPRPAAPPKPRSLYDAVIRPHEHELVWYSFAHKLPDVSPRDSQVPNPPASELLSRDQTIISNPAQADRGTQMIWRPAPQIKPQPPIVSPNILAFQRPLITPPPKLFVPPRPVARPSSAPPLTPPPPIEARANWKVNPILLAGLTAPLQFRPKPRDFVPPAPKPETKKVPLALPEAPSVTSALRSARVPLLAENMAAPLASKPQPPQFVPPPAQQKPAASPAALPDAPKLSTHLAASASLDNPALQSPTLAALARKPDPKPFVPPIPARSGAPSVATAPPIEETPSPDLAGMPTASVNVAIVGLNPAEKLSGPLPDSSRDAKFSTSPNAEGNAGGAGRADSSALSVPGLLVRGGHPQNVDNPVLLARAAPTSREMLEAAMKSAGSTIHDAAPAPEIRLAPPPDPAFNGRDVYTLAVQMPNISSYVGSWIMWFADRDRAPGGRRPLRPPVPLHKVDPKYLPAAISERVEGKVQIAGVIRANGRVDLLRILRGVDPRLDQSAEEALMKWEFAPAERNGIPVEVDLVAEIPFQLAPQVKR